MYGYSEYFNLTPEQILQKVTQEQIFELILGEVPSFNKLYKSPLRTDKHAGSRFEERPDGTILWIDFGDTPTHRSCFRFVMDYKKYDLSQAINFIANQYHLSEDPSDYSSITPLIKRHYESEPKAFTEILFDKRAYQSRDRKFWNLVSISTDNLLEDGVYSAGRVYINNKAKGTKKAFTPVSLCYGISFFEAIKIYQPYNSTHKFITNCNENHIGNIHNLSKIGNTLIISKAYKDHRIFRNFGWSDTVWFMSEGVIPSVDILLDLVGRFDRIVVFYDNDERGLLAASRLVSILNSLREGVALMQHIPIQYQYKDLGAFLPKEGKHDTIKLLNQLGL